MAISIIPSDTSGLTNGENNILGKIKSIYKNENSKDCYIYIKPRIRNLEPDFILIDPLKGICIIEVKDWSLNYIKEINRIEVKTRNGKVLYNPIFRANQYFNLAKGLFESDTRLLDNEGKPTYNLYSKVFFVNIPSNQIKTIENTLNQYPSEYFASDEIRNLNIYKLFSNESCYINSAQLLVIRAILFPEIKIFDSGAQPGIDTSNSDEIYKTLKALDRTQEQFAKRIPNGHYMVSGVPGSGKTVILLSRALYLLKENPEWQIKIVTYNRSLTHSLESRLNHLSQDIDFMGIGQENISISTFHQVALETANIAVPQDAGNDFWKNELPKIALEGAQSTYDAILIDEYQDFYHDWIKVCIKLTKYHVYNGEQIQNIFLAGDRLQSIYNPKEVIWKEIGINIQGGEHSKLLKYSYRAGNSHIDLALKLLMSDKSIRREVNKFYEGRDGIMNITNINDEIGFVEGGYDSIAELLHQLIYVVGYKPEDILILAPRWDDANNLYAVLSDEIKENCRVIKDVIEKVLIITTYYSSKGIESRICILLNIERIDDLKLIYVGMTRASERLYIHSNDFRSNTIANKLRNGTFE